MCKLLILRGGDLKIPQKSDRIYFLMHSFHHCSNIYWRFHPVIRLHRLYYSLKLHYGEHNFSSHAYILQAIAKEKTST